VSDEGGHPGLRGLPTPLLLETSTDDIVQSFFEPALKAAVGYDRGVGYFSSGWLLLAARGLEAFAENAGRARFLVSPHLSEEDWQTIQHADEARRDELLREELLRTVEQMRSLGENPRIALLSALVATGALEFRLAIPRRALDGDFHDKFGVFRDPGGDRIAFHGSQNDSVHAYRNFEAISLYYSWLGATEASRVSSHAERFDRLWNDRDPNLRSIAVPDVVLDELKLIRFQAPSKGAMISSGRPVATWAMTEPSKLTITPSPVKSAASHDSSRWSHQDEAVTAFCEAGSGILEMATGTGKTRTALKILNRLWRDGSITSCVITMSGTDLLDQWYEELISATDLVVYRSYGGTHDELSFFNDPRGALLLVSRQALPAIVTRMNDAFAREALLICDEVHGMGSASIVRELTGTLIRFRHRLGLSATPEREYDAEGVRFIGREIGPVVFRFGLEEAIKKGVLCGFDYVDLYYDFSENDKAAVRAAISSYYAKRKAGLNPSIETMYRDIAAVAKTTRSKLPAFERYVKSNPKILKRAVLFVETADFGLDVQRIILPITTSYHTYYAEDDRRNLVLFANGALDTVITCHRISEGIDIRSVNAIVLFASSRARLETVQRLGRCLRKDPANPSKRALVIDFIRHDDIPDEETKNPTTDQARRNWLRGLSLIAEDTTGDSDY
jgi:superfamily II DNA or RNA helicase